MAIVLKFQRHCRVSVGKRRARKAAKTSNVIGFRSFSAKRTKSGQRAGGIPRLRQELTVDRGRPNQLATAPVPPKASMQASSESMEDSIVRSLRTCQVFADGETTFTAGYGQIRAMIDPPSVIGPRLKALRTAVGCKSQAAFAKSIGVERNTYNPWEKGQRPLTFEGALLIRKRYRIPLDYLFFGEGVDEIPAGILNKLQQAA